MEGLNGSTFARRRRTCLSADLSLDTPEGTPSFSFARYFFLFVLDIAPVEDSGFWESLVRMGGMMRSESRHGPGPASYDLEFDSESLKSREMLLIILIYGA